MNFQQRGGNCLSPSKDIRFWHIRTKAVLFVLDNFNEKKEEILQSGEYSVLYGFYLIKKMSCQADNSHKVSRLTFSEK